MKPPILRYPVALPDGTELMPAGTLLTRESLEEAIHRREKTDYPGVRLFDHGSLLTDLHRFCREAPYDRMFSNKRQVAGVFDLMAQIELVAPFLPFWIGSRERILTPTGISSWSLPSRFF